MKRNQHDEFKTIVGFKKRAELDFVIVSIQSPTIFDGITLMSKVYANEDLIEIIMAYDIEVTVPCKCREKFRCSHCTLASLECFNPVWDTEVLSVPKPFMDCITHEERKNFVNINREHREKIVKRHVTSRRIHPTLLGPVSTVVQPHEIRATVEPVVHPLRTGGWRVDHIWEKEDTSQWRHWYNSLKRRVLRKVDRKDGIIANLKEFERLSLREELLDLISALYTTKHLNVKQKSCMFECPMCDKRDMTATELTVHCGRKHRTFYNLLISKCPTKLVQHVLMNSCFPTKRWRLRAIQKGIFPENQECVCAKIKKVNFSRNVLRPQRQWHYFMTTKNLTLEDVDACPELPLLSDNLVSFLFGKRVPENISESSLKHALETDFMQSVETNTFSESAMRARKRKHATIL